MRISYFILSDVIINQICLGLERCSDKTSNLMTSLWALGNCVFTVFRYLITQTINRLIKNITLRLICNENNSICQRTPPLTIALLNSESERRNIYRAVQRPVSIRVIEAKHNCGDKNKMSSTALTRSPPPPPQPPTFEVNIRSSYWQEKPQHSLLHKTALTSLSTSLH